MKMVRTLAQHQEREFDTDRKQIRTWVKQEEHT